MELPTPTAVLNGVGSTVQNNNPDLQQPTTPQAPPDQPPRESQSAKFDALARREKQFARQRQELKAKEQEIAAKEAEFKKWTETKDRARQNPDEYLAQAGMTYDDYVQWKLNGGQQTPELAVKDDVAKVKTQLQKMQDDEKARLEHEAESRNRQVQEQIEEFKTDCHDFVHGDPDAYELTLLYKSEDLVFQTIQTHWQNSMAEYEQAIENGDTPRKPTIMNKKEAADLVEQYLEGLVDQTTKTKKWGKKWGAPPVEPPSEPRPTGFQAKTLSNSLSQSSTPPPPTSATITYRSEADAFKRALAKLSGQ